MQTMKKRKSASSTEQRLRREIAVLLAIEPTELREWNTLICPECRQPVARTAICPVLNIVHLSPLFYVLAPETSSGDMPLGIGESAVQALMDLLMTIKMTILLDRIGADL